MGEKGGEDIGDEEPAGATGGATTCENSRRVGSTAASNGGGPLGTSASLRGEIAVDRFGVATSIFFILEKLYYF